LDWYNPKHDKTERIVELTEGEFAKDMRQLHKDAGVPILHNRLRRSAISHYLAYHTDSGIGQLAALGWQ
jgi:hypothetical protein